ADTLADTPARRARLTASLQHANRAHADTLDAVGRARVAVTEATRALQRARTDAVASARAARDAQDLVDRRRKSYADA
ncbi:hypothetical protein NGM37_33890, partial [Streptomyces sp. TRM76130]|nr:hypothetical protein [Streptomyces sp. TRM76130]